MGMEGEKPFLSGSTGATLLKEEQGFSKSCLLPAGWVSFAVPLREVFEVVISAGRCEDVWEELAESINLLQPFQMPRLKLLLSHRGRDGTQGDSKGTLIPV